MPATLGLTTPEQVNSLLVGVIRTIDSGPQVEPLAGAVAALVTEVTATDVCFVHVLDDADTTLTLAGATPPFDHEVGCVRLPVGTGVTGWVAAHRRPAVIVEDKPGDPRYVAFPTLRGRDYTSMASVPMCSDPAGLVGVLNVHTRGRREFTHDDLLLLTGIGTLVAGAVHQARLRRRLEGHERALERFTHRVVAAQESDRQHLARDIHEGITQRLISLSYHLDTARRSSDAAAGEDLDRARDLVDLGLAEARAAVDSLRPPVLDDLGLSGGLSSLASAHTELAVRVDLSVTRLPEHVEVAFYRIAQEALHNVFVHAGIGAAAVRFTVDDDTARLEIDDRGRGFERALVDDSDRGCGLLSMTERARRVGGALTVHSHPGVGTTVTATVPVGVSSVRGCGADGPAGDGTRDGGSPP